MKFIDKMVFQKLRRIDKVSSENLVNQKHLPYRHIFKTVVKVV